MNAVLPTAFRSLLLLAARRLMSGRPAETSAPVPQGRIRNRTLHAVLAVLGVIYTIWPIDLIPDVIPLLGWLDDGLVLLFTLRQTFQALRPRRDGE